MSETRMYRVVAARIQQLIRQQEIGPGERLPSERDLAASLNVSRASLREGLIALELAGEIEVRGGSGIYASAHAPPQLAVEEAGPGPFEVLAARHFIETEIAAMAAKNATEAELDAILLAMMEMERSHDEPSSNEPADRNFHLAIARASGNAALVDVVSYLWTQRTSLWRRFKEHYRTEDLRKSTLLDHRAIFSAIAAHDAVGARKAMRAHLQRVSQTFAGKGA